MNATFRNQLGVMIVLGLIVGGVIFIACDRSSKVSPEVPVQQTELRVLGLLGEFELTDQSGAAFGSQQLRGKVWVANFMFTHCASTCPAQTAKLAELQKQLQNDSSWDEIRLVSVSVDPQRDTPEVLAKYADQAGADPLHWKFLTGQRDAIWRLSQESFNLPVSENPQSQADILHSPKLILIDPYLRIRGLYDLTPGDELARLRNDLDRVMQEKMPVPSDVLNPSGMVDRRTLQMRTLDEFKVFHDFSFTDTLIHSGIGFRNKIVDDAGKNYKAVHYDHGNGLAVADVDGDGLLDIYFVTQAGPNQLWRNLGEGRFEDITDRAGVAMQDVIGVTASFADIDNDGDPDLFATSVRGGNRLFENLGEGNFKDISQAAGLDYKGHSSAAVFFDYNRDGLLDLFLTNVGKYTSDEIATVTMEQVRGEQEASYEYYSGLNDAFAGHLKPGERNERSILYKNMGKLRFQDVSEQVQLIDVGWAGAASPVDFNRDGWIDLYVLNMQGPDHYYVNHQGERFEEKSLDFFPLTPWGAMGVKTFDYNNDGHMDLFITDMHSDMSQEVGPNKERLKADMQWPESMLLTNGKSVWGNALYRNDGQGRFAEVSDQFGAENYWPWGFSVGDLNASGFDDAFIASSMNYPFRYSVNSLLLNNLGERFLHSEFILGVEPRSDGRFAEPWFELDCDGEDRQHHLAKDRTGRVVIWSALGTRSSVIFDLDNDGDLDIVTNEFNSTPQVLVSNLAEKKNALNYLKIQLVGEKSNRDGLGAFVQVKAGERTYLKCHDGQSGYLSQSLIPLYFGLGEADRVDQIEVTWPSGGKQIIPGPIEANQTIQIKEE